MGWIESIGEAIHFIEDNIMEDITMEEIAKHAFLSPFYFQKGFAMLCGFTVGEYVRQRRLTLAGNEIVSTDKKIIDIALRYGYNSPDSFTKAFTRFHSVTPTAVRKNGAMMKSFAPLKIKFILEGGSIMDYKIVEKEAFTVLAATKKFKYENAKVEVPAFWEEHYQSGKGELVCGLYGINIDEDMGGDEFEYSIAADYNPSKEIPAGLETKIIPKFTWAVFACKGAISQSFRDVNQRIFSEWLPNSKDYEIAAGYNVEMYNNPAEYPKGTEDDNYYGEVWIPVKKK